MKVAAEPFKGHDRWVDSVAFSLDGTHIVSSGGDGKVRVWTLDGKAAMEPFTVKKLGGWVATSVAFSPDSSWEADEQSGAIRRGVGGAKGRDRGAGQLSTRRTPSRVSVTQGVGSHTATYCRRYPRWEKLWGGRRRSWHLHRPYELMEIAPWPKSMISAET
jgi:WD domain, G-beta repeat